MKKKDIETQENFSAECGQVYEKTKKENEISDKIIARLSSGDYIP